MVGTTKTPTFMTLQAYKALLKSIEHWEENVAHPHAMKLGPTHCPLCREFRKARHDCDGCPVKERTGKPFCRGTPYDQFDRNVEPMDPDDTLSVAEEELAFLKSLLPEHPPTQ